MALGYAELGRARSLLDEVRRGWAVVSGPDAPEVRIKAGILPRKPAEIQEHIPDEAQLLEYAVLADKLIIWVIKRTGIITKSVAISADELNALAESFLAVINTPPGKADQRWRKPAAELYDRLIGPVEALLDRHKPIYILPDKRLTKLPFGVLLAPQTQRLLVEDYVIGYAESSNMFLDATQNAKQKMGTKSERMLAVGNPSFDPGAFPGLANLKPAEDEAKYSATYYQSSVVLLEQQATKNNILRELARSDVAHLAMHYVTDPWSPMLSRLPLAAGRGEAGWLQMHELYQLPALPLRLVILSACQTRGEEYFGGEGAIGVTRPFEAAGVPLVIASLWPVAAESTAELLSSFHRLRKLDGQIAVAALRSAQLEMLHGGSDYRHPYFWAAFVAVGGRSEY